MIVYRQLEHREREIIAMGLKMGWSKRRIAREIGRNPSTISRETRRNSMNGNCYLAFYATFLKEEKRSTITLRSCLYSRLNLQGKGLKLKVKGNQRRRKRRRILTSSGQCSKYVPLNNIYRRHLVGESSRPRQYTFQLGKRQLPPEFV